MCEMQSAGDGAHNLIPSTVARHDAVRGAEQHNTGGDDVAEDDLLMAETRTVCSDLREGRARASVVATDGKRAAGEKA